MGKPGSAEDRVTEGWDYALRTAAEDFPSLLPLVEEAERTPALRALFPYFGHEWLFFSRYTEFPYSYDLPHGRAEPEGGFLVRAPVGRVELRTRSPREAVRFLLTHLPPGCGPAVLGSADDFEDR